MQIAKYYTYILLDPRKPKVQLLKGTNIILKYEPFYVGKGKNKRAEYHLKFNHYNEPNKLKRNIIKKIKSIGLMPLIYKTALTFENVALENEKYLINIIGRRDLNRGPLSNLTNGGELNIGCKRTKEQLEKMKIASTGRRHTEETKIKISKVHKNRIFSEQQKLNISKALKGRKNPHSKNNLNKAIIKNLKKVEMIDKNNTIIKTYNSIKEASLDTGISTHIIGRMASGYTKNLKSVYKWRYSNVNS